MTEPNELIPPDLVEHIRVLTIQGQALHSQAAEWAAAVSDATGAFEDAIRWLGLDDDAFRQAERDAGLVALAELLDRFTDLDS